MRVRLIFFALAASGAILGILVLYRHARPTQIRIDNPALRVFTTANSADIGIPGITKMYEGHLKNVGPAPVQIQVCDALNDGMGREVHVAHAIERWDVDSKRWKLFWRIPKKEFCRPYPTGILHGEVKEAVLEPGRSISTGDVAIQASDGLRIGDRLRFVIFPNNDEKTAIPGAEFEIDERPTGR